MKKYQEEYAAGRPQMYDKKSRIQKAVRMLKTLSDYYVNNKKLKKLTLLDIGSSTGIIAYELAKSFKKVVGIDIDKGGVKFAKKNFKRNNLSFKVDDAMKMKVKSNSFDVVVCTQIYEHVPDPTKLMDEIHRVLKPRGVCYFAALNKYFPIEPHYNLPFLAIMPKDMANMYVRFMGKAKEYYETPLSYWELKKLCKKYKIHDYTKKIIDNPKKYGYENDIQTKGIKGKLTETFSFTYKVVAPTFFWILEKK